VSDVLDTCGCRPREEQPPAVFNRPGLAALEYRIGTHGTLLRRMLRRIAEWSPPEDQGKRPLAPLTTRVLDDPAIALLDAWAVTGDVLTFYQERIANEGFLRTATERRSVLELAREIGYELNPGVAASTHLVWEVEQSFAVAGQTPPGMAPPPREVLVAAGTKVQSMPGQDELPQTFETSADLVARSDLNQLRPRLTVPQAVSLGSRVLFIEGIATGFVRGDRVLISSGPRFDKNETTGEPLPGVDVSLLEVTDVVPEPALGRTRLDLKVLPKQPPHSQPALPTQFQIKPDNTFVPPDPPPEQPVAPAKIEPPVYILVPRPLTIEEIRDRVLAYAWRNPGLLVQLALLGWNPVAVVDLINRLRIGLDLGPVWVKHLVAPARDITRPSVVSVFPPDGSEAGRDTRVIVRFSEPMNAESAVNAVTLRDVTNSTDVPATKEYNPVTGAVRLTPTAKLGADQEGDFRYKVTVDDTIAKDRAGNLLAARIETEFVVLDRKGPNLVSTDPPVEPEATNRPPETVVTAKFDQALDDVTVTADTFFLRDGTGTRVAAALVLSDGGRTATLKPHAPLSRSMRYTATLTNGITDKGTAKKNPIAPVEWSFTTVLRAPVVPEPELAVYRFRETTAFFGHNAPRWASLPKPAAGSERDGDPWEFSWDDPPRSVWVDSQGSSLGGDTVNLDRAVPGLEAGGWTVFESVTGAAVYHVIDASARSVADYGMSGRTSRLVLSQHDGRSPCEGAGAPADFRVRESSAHVASERLQLVELPIETKLLAGDTEIVLNGMAFGLEQGGLVALRGELADLPGAIGDEILEVEGSFHNRGFTTLVLREPGLRRSYVRKTVMMNANVVPATHGETVGREVLGGGDGAHANQLFALRRPPLTYVSAPTASGADSTVEIRIDGVRWDEATALYGLGPRSRSYIVRASDAGVPVVIFGDGEQGARPPTGTENIVATYRTGIGLSGLVGAGRITLLRERPLGIVSVNNPMPTTGAADPENRDAAKENAPRTVLTMERIVSLRDFEDFARGFAGIDKAQSIAIWQGDRQRVVVTVAARNADESSALFKNLVDAVGAATEPGLDISVRSYRRRFFDLEAAIRVDPAYLVGQVLDATRRAVLTAFAFERRTFGQPVTAAEVVHVIQTAPGVVATYLDALYPLERDIEATIDNDAERPLEPVLLPRPAELVEAKYVGAELLLVNPAGVTITERTV
jgi:Bacterial Ig-like domain